MRRLLLTLLVAGCAGGFWLLAGGASNGPKTPSYTAVLDSGFGLVEGADVKVAGVRAGKISSMKLDRQTNKALIGIQLADATGYRSFRSDVFCESKPQSLIGEYFIDCTPGSSPTVLKPGSRIPLSQTATTIAPDLVNDILRLPQRERLRIILNELGTGVAARGDELNQAIRRAVPALRETDKLLAILATQGQTIADLTRDADTVITSLADNKADVVRFVQEARDTSVASASRRVALAQTFQKLPAFLAELRPAMRDLGRVADAQTPALRDLNAEASQLQTFFNRLGPFADASRPATRALGQTGIVGRKTVNDAGPTVDELTKFSVHAPETAKNLAIVLEDLYNRDRAVETDKRAPVGPDGKQGFNGLEALLGYVFWQAQAINIFDKNGYILKVAAVRPENCVDYHDATYVKANPDVAAKCASALGPNQPGVNAPDPTAGPVPKAKVAQAKQSAADLSTLAAAQSAAGAAPARNGVLPAGNGQAGTQQAKPPISLSKTVGSLLGGVTQGNAASAVTGLGGASAQGTSPDTNTQTALLDYLFRP